MKGMTAASGTFSKAVTFVEFAQSGNPQEKYKAGRGVLSKFIKEASQTGTYVPYIDQVFTETTHRLDELEREIAAYYKATFTPSLEHTNPEAYLKMRLLESMDAES